MKKRISYRKTPKIIHTKTQIILLSVVCFFGTVFFYYLMVVLREAIGISFNLFSTNEKFILIPSEKDTLFYNFITAVFASIYGISIFFKYLFIPINQYRYKITSFKKYHVISDTSILFTGFYMMAVRFLFFLFSVFDGVFPKNSGFSGYNVIWILFIIVMYLELWKTILLIYGKKAIYKMILIALIIVPFSFGLSKVDLYGFDKIYQTHIENQVEYKYQIEYPKSTYYEREEYYSRRFILNLNIGYRRDRDKETFPNIIYRDKEITLKNLSKIINDFKETTPLPRIIVKIKADKNLKMKYLNQLKDTLFKYNLKKIAYKVIPGKPNSTYEFEEYSIYKKIIPRPDAARRKIEKSFHHYKIHVISRDTIRVNGELQKLDALKIKKILKKYTNKAFLKLTLDENATFGDYIYVASYFLEIYIDLRNEYCLQLNGYSYKEQIRRTRYGSRNEGERKKLNTIREKYPMQLFYDYFDN